MKKDKSIPKSQDLDRKRGQDNVANSPRAAKNIPPKPNNEDKRKEARQEHTNHFSSRAGHPEKK